MKNYVVFKVNGFSPIKEFMTKVTPYHSFELVPLDKALRFTLVQAIKITRPSNVEALACNSSVRYGYFIPS